MCECIDGTIKASYSNYGYIPYGHSVIGKLYYDPKNPDACEEYTEREFN